MEAMRQNWTDDRMDDLGAQVDAGFAQARVDLGSTREELRREIKAQGEELRREIKAQGEELRREIKAQGEELRGEIKAQGDELRVGIEAQGKELRGETREQGRELRGEIQALAAIVAAGQRTMFQICGGLCVALIAAIATVVSTAI